MFNAMAYGQRDVAVNVRSLRDSSADTKEITELVLPRMF